jgi:hypothetical protein
MPDILTQLGQYCVIDTDTHDDEYLVSFHDRYYNHGFSNGFSKFVYCACKECGKYLFSSFRLGDVVLLLRVYESTIDVIKERTNKKSIDYYEAVRIAMLNIPGFVIALPLMSSKSWINHAIHEDR